MNCLDRVGRGTGAAVATRLLLIPCACLLFSNGGPNAAFAGAYSWIVQDGDPQPFRTEILLAEQAQDRDTRVQHLQQALTYRPGNPANLAIEYHIAAELSQRWDPEHPQPLRREEALNVVRGIVAKYKHLDYYEPTPANSVSSMQSMVPEAEIWGACLERALNNDTEKAREYCLLAMQCLQQTYQKRIEDCKRETPPPRPSPTDPFEGGPIELSKWESRMHLWEERQRSAHERSVFGVLEMGTVKAAVRQFGYTYGRQPEEVAVVMNEIIRRFPDTPMAEIAQEHIDRAAKMVSQGILEDLESDMEPFALRPLGTAEGSLSPRRSPIGPEDATGVSRSPELGSPIEHNASGRIPQPEPRHSAWPYPAAAFALALMSSGVIVAYRRRKKGHGVSKHPVEASGRSIRGQRNLPGL
jgi:hypothetical protein